MRKLKDEIRELNDAELDPVAGGCVFYPPPPQGGKTNPFMVALLAASGNQTKGQTR